MSAFAWIPPYEKFIAYLKVDISKNGRGSITVDRHFLRFLIDQLVENLEVDSTYYLSANPDIAAATRSGLVKDPAEHFYKTGYYEGRSSKPTVVDEQWYLTQYPDVKKALDAGKLASATEHFLESGAFEGRAPNAATFQAMSAWASAMKSTRG